MILFYSILSNANHFIFCWLACENLLEFPNRILNSVPHLLVVVTLLLLYLYVTLQGDTLLSQPP